MMSLYLAAQKEVYRLTEALVAFGRDEEGATAIEYALIASLIALAIIGGVRTIAPTLNSTFNTVSTSLETANAVTR